MAEPFVLPILGFGSDDSPPSYTVTWKSGDVVYRGILGDYGQHAEPVPDGHIIPDNVISFDEFKEKRNAIIKERSL